MPSSNRDLAGLIFNIQRHSTEDGPGIRTTVFLKGCPMRCPWCHNPEGMDKGRQLVWYKARCIGTRACVEECPGVALSLSREGMVIDRSTCDLCQICVAACPTGALEVMGRRATVAEVVEQVLRDRAFYEVSGGGATLSGGEPSMQPRFARALMQSLRDEKIHVALDTCGGIAWKRLGPLVELADLVLYDLKVLDHRAHRQHTGIRLDLVLDNAAEIAKMGKPMWIRTPIIPGYTDDEKSIRAIARFIRDALPTVERYDLLAFNNTCEGKYQRLGLSFALAGEGLVSEETMSVLTAAAHEEGIEFAHWSGMTRMQEGQRELAEKA